MKSEFRVAGQREYDRRGPVRWIVSHLLQNRWYAVAASIGLVFQVGLNSTIPGLVGRAFDEVLETPPDLDALGVIALVLLAITAARGLLDLGQALSWEVLAKRIERETRDELYVSLLGKSQTFHNRQRVGDLMARAANDVRTLNEMVNPGVVLIVDSITGLIDADHLYRVPRLAVAALAADFHGRCSCWRSGATCASSTRSPGAMRMQFGVMNAGLNGGGDRDRSRQIDGQEQQEHGSFITNAREYRNAAVQQGMVRRDTCRR